MFGDRPILLIIHSEAPRTAANTSYESHHTDPILKNLCILPIIDMYLAEIGKIMFQYNTGSLPFKCMRFISFFLMYLFPSYYCFSKGLPFS